MKRTILSIAIIVCGCLMMSSCKKEDKFGSYRRDESLAGSVAYPYYITKGEVSFDGAPVENMDPNASVLHIRKFSDKEVGINCFAQCEDALFQILIPTAIPIYGIPYDITLDYSCDNAVVYIDEKGYTDVAVSVKGWIKKQDHDDRSADTRYSIASLYYRCDITIECNLDGKILLLKITYTCT